jgi:cytochrome c5
MNHAVHGGRRRSLRNSQAPLIAAAVFALAAVGAAQPAASQGAERSGKDVVEATCARCHATGVDGAPKIGDNKAWSKLSARGLSGLTRTALAGIRKMPSHGGDASLSDNEVKRAIAYMVNQSGGKWVEPIGRTKPAAERSGERVVKLQCAKCHESGEGGAPRIGDRAAWTPRMKQGLDALVRSAIQGHGGMPARGGMADLTDAEVRAAITYMFDPSRAPAAKAAAAPAAPRDEHRQVAGGMEILLGVVSAETLRKRRSEVERTMHGGVPGGKGYYHVNISLHDSTSRAEIKDAEVQARVAHPVTGGETKKLEAVVINDMVSYGNYFRMPGRDPYAVTVQIRRPGAPQPVEAKFEVKNY